MVKFIGYWFSIVLFLMLYLLPNKLVSADVLRINGGISSDGFVDNFNVTNGEPLVFIDADWSFDNGAFLGGDCYQSSAERGRGEALERGCHAYIGYFTPINETQAVSFELRHNRYLVNTGSFWTDYELAGSWHINKGLTFSATFNDNWLDSGHATFSVQGDYSRPLTDKFTSYVSVSLMQFEAAAIGITEHIQFGVNYQQDRWSVDLSAIFSDAALGNALGFDVNQNQLLLTFTYQLY